MHSGPLGDLEFQQSVAGKIVGYMSNAIVSFSSFRTEWNQFSFVLRRSSKVEDLFGFCWRPLNSHNTNNPQD